jgi:hypothetical protein
MENKYLTLYGHNNINFSGGNYSFMTRISSNFSEIKKWTTPQINVGLMGNHLLTKREWTVNFESQGKDNLLTPLSLKDRKTLQRNAILAETKIREPVESMIFSEDLIPFAYRFSTGGKWFYIMGAIDGWKDLTYSDLANIVDESKKSGETVRFIWKVSDIIFSSSTINMIDIICALVTDQYCDKHIPAATTKSNVASKVTLGGFSFITYYVCKYLNQTATKYQIKAQYEKLDDLHAIPYIPTKWQPDIEMINSDKLQEVIKKLGNTSDASNEEKIMDAMAEIKHRIDANLKGENDTGKWLKLSDILDVRFNMYYSRELYDDEYMVDIDEPIISNDIELSEENILLGVFGWGVLELLIEDNILSADERSILETELELNSGVPISILTVSSDNGKTLVERMTNNDAKA